jgi:hypothetical protein
MPRWLVFMPGYQLFIKSFATCSLFLLLPAETTKYSPAFRPSRDAGANVFFRPSRADEGGLIRSRIRLYLTSGPLLETLSVPAVPPLPGLVGSGVVLLAGAFRLSGRRWAWDHRVAEPVFVYKAGSATPGRT